MDVLAASLHSALVAPVCRSGIQSLNLKCYCPLAQQLDKDVCSAFGCEFRSVLLCHECEFPSIVLCHYLVDF